MRLSHVLKNAKVTATVGPLVYGLLQAVTLATISQFGRADDLGLFLLAQAVATPAGLLLGLRLRDQLSTASETARAGPYVGRQLRLAAGSMLVGAFGWSIASGIGEDQPLFVVGVTVLGANFAQAICWTVQGQMLADARFPLVSLIDVVLGLTSLLSVFVGYQIFGSLEASTVLLLCSWSLVATAIVVRFAKGSLLSPSPTTLLSDLALGASSMAAVGQISVGRLGTSALLGNAALARVGTGSFMVRSALPVVRGILRVNAEALGRAARSDTDEYAQVERRIVQRSVWFVLLTSAPAAALGYAVGPGLIGLAFDDSSVASAATFSWLVGSSPALFGSMAMSQVLVARSDSRGALLLSLGALLCTGISVWPLSSNFGEAGAAASIAFGYAARLAIGAWRIRR